MKPNLYVSPEDVDTLLSGFPAYKDLPDAHRNLLRRLASVQFSDAVAEGFYFPCVHANLEQKIACIKALRVLTGLGLKESKEAVEQQTRFSLVGYNLTKDAVLEVVSNHSSTAHKMVVNFE